MNEAFDALAHEAWGIIANVSGGDWEQQATEWQAAANRWRDLFHYYLETGEVMPDV